MQELAQASWIWKQGEVCPDDYAEFTGAFLWNGEGKVFLSISADSNCNVYLNGELVFFRQCSDYPHYKLYDRLDITRFCGRENRLHIAVWYYGKDSACYYLSTPGLIFAVSQEEHVLLASGPQIQSRRDVRYRYGRGIDITKQLGLSWFYDNTAVSLLPYTESVVVDKQVVLRRNPLKPLALRQPSACHVLQQSSSGVLVDIGREEAGFLTLQLVSSQEQTITVAFGEHIIDGGVRSSVLDYRFQVQLRLKKGENVYRNCFRRIAGRYLEISCTHPLQVQYLGITPVYYPLERRELPLADGLDREIYNTAVRTLELCMHEHYEDCPWREQALYVLDSRNQMLCGYYCFGEFDYPRENLVLMAKGIKPDGLLELTYPARNTPAIPFFSLMYPVAVREYVEHSGDRTILQETLPAMEKIMAAFRERVEENGLIANLPWPYWNFYEWSCGSDHANEIHRTAQDPYTVQYDLILNCAYVLATESWDALTGGKSDTAALKSAIHRQFYCPEKGLYCAGTAQPQLFTELGNSLAVLSAVTTGEMAAAIAKKLMQGGEMVDATLSMLCYKYDALLRAFPSAGDDILQGIRRRYGAMLEAGATSFWETEKGAEDMCGAGSLCHGWSAMPVYYYHKIWSEKEKGACG